MDGLCLLGGHISQAIGVLQNADSYAVYDTIELIGHDRGHGARCLAQGLPVALVYPEGERLPVDTHSLCNDSVRMIGLGVEPFGLFFLCL